MQTLTSQQSNPTRIETNSTKANPLFAKFLAVTDVLLLVGWQGSTTNFQISSKLLRQSSLVFNTMLKDIFFEGEQQTTRGVRRISLPNAFGDKLGRRRMMWLAMCFILVGASLQASSFSVPHLVIGRIITGFGTGIDSSTVPTYQAELCRKEKRGALVSTEILFIGIGIVTAYWFDYGMSFRGGSVAWRVPIAFQLSFAIFVIILLFGLPESPRWLFKHGRGEEAIEVLCAVYDLPRDDDYIVSETRNILHAIEIEKAGGSNKIPNLFRNDRLKTGRRVLLAWFALFMNQMVGINLVVYYMPTVLVKNVGLNTNLSQILGGCINVMFCIGALAPSFALDRMGRRKTMMFGCFGLGVCMMMASILLSIQNNKKTSIAAVSFFFLYMLIFGGTINCVPWVYGPEILPLEARTRGVAISISSHWTWNFFVVMMMPILIQRLEWNTYLTFMSLSYAFVPIVYFFYPETSNISSVHRIQDFC